MKLGDAAFAVIYFIWRNDETDETVLAERTRYPGINRVYKSQLSFCREGGGSEASGQPGLAAGGSAEQSSLCWSCLWRWDFSSREVVLEGEKHSDW